FDLSDSQLIFVVKKDNTVYFMECSTGLSYGDYGLFIASSLVPEVGWSDYSNYAMLDTENNYIYCESNTVTYSAGRRGYYLSNRFGMLAITLPGGTRPVRYETISSLNASVPDPSAEVKTVYFNGVPGMDVKSVRFQVFAGEDAVTDMAEVQEFEAGNYFAASWECPEDGDYTASFYALNESGEVKDTQSVGFTVKSVSAYDYWLGTWSIQAYDGNNYDYTIEADEVNCSFILNGMAVPVPVLFDQETGDIVFETGKLVYESSKYQTYTMGWGEDIYMTEGVNAARFVMREDKVSADVRPEMEDIDIFGIYTHILESDGWSIFSYSDIILASQTIKKTVEEQNGAPALRSVCHRTLEIPSDATLISKK
ncbi:MAG: hypothetical protein J5835_03705, partial [Bacteroidales bacterium]|nr:hypothetical protein [Bacteroidales bacterium]